MTDANEPLDVIVLGAGGAGMFCAIHAGRRGKKVLILDHSSSVGGKILISGGGRCNFTNLGATASQYVSENPHFMKSALARFKPRDFIEMLQGHKIAFHEKKLGQLFCDHSAKDIVAMLLKECTESRVKIELGVQIEEVKKRGAIFEIRTPLKTFAARSVVVATGGLSLPKLGATGLGYEVAKNFGIGIVETAPALDGFSWISASDNPFYGLAGLATDAEISTGGVIFREALLITHTGLSGPASLQASLYWKKGQEVRINFFPDIEIYEILRQEKKSSGLPLLKTILGRWLPSRLAERLLELAQRKDAIMERPLPEIPDLTLKTFSDVLTSFQLTPDATVGYSKAEVTRGGIDTNELSSRTMESKKVPGLYFIGEVVDVTGWLGGYNFQWAWASGFAAGQAVE